MRILSTLVAAAVCVASLRAADGRVISPSAEMLARKAVSGKPAEAASAIRELRSLGQLGLDAILAAYANEIQTRREGLSSPGADAEWKLIAAAIDGVAGQKDAYASGLYWHTDLAQAKAEAAQKGRPVLSLRLLGRLDEDLSCANSRFFRLTLYSNSTVSKLLRERFVLHWESVRPVPKITIDFGDGRKLERTLTGNSIHYVLDSTGRVIDALPGLYGPAAFGRRLERAAELFRSLGQARNPGAWESLLRQYHQIQLDETSNAWAADIARAGVSVPPRRDLSRPGDQDNPPTAAEASKRAITKMIRIEKPIIRGLGSKAGALEASSEDAQWAKIGRLYAQDARLDSSSLALIRNKNWGAYGRKGDTSFQQAVNALERAIAEDTARNRYTFETTLHQWFIEGTATRDLRELNDRVYAELFLTPSTDPWLGLFPADSYIGIENEGVTK